MGGLVDPETGAILKSEDAMLKQEQEGGGACHPGNQMVVPGDIKSEPPSIKDEPRENGTESLFDDNLDSKDNRK